MQYLLTEDEYKALSGSEENEAYKELLSDSHAMRADIQNFLMKSNIRIEKNVRHFGEEEIYIRVNATDAPAFLVEVLKRRGDLQWR